MRVVEVVDKLRKHLKAGFADREVFDVLRAFQDDAIESAAWLASKRSKSIADDIRMMKAPKA